MTRLLLTNDVNDPGPAASAKNPAGPGLPTQSANDRERRNPMVDDARAAKVRARALTTLDAALDAVDVWLAHIRQGAERRTDSLESEAVVGDPAYAEALTLSVAITTAHIAFARRAAAIEAGEVR